MNVCCIQATPGMKCFPILKEPLRYLTNPIIPLLSAIKLSQVIRKVKPDVIHITVEPYAMIVPFIGKKNIKRTVLTIHGSYGIRPLLQFRTRCLALQYYKKITLFITVSNYTKDAVSRTLKRKHHSIAQHFSENAHVIHNGIAIPTMPRHSQSNERKEILLVGGIKPRKGVLQAIEACSEFRKLSSSPFHFSIVGTFKEDAYTKQVRNRIYELDLVKNVSVLGAVPESVLKSLYQKTDLYLMPSITTPDTFEGFGLVFLEANAHGIPNIGPETSGAAEAIKEGISGYHVNPDNPKIIAQRMHWILDEGRISREQCRSYAESRSDEKMIQETERVYSLLVHDK